MAALHALVTDVPAYPSFLPWCLGTTVENVSPEGIRASMEVGLRGFRQRFTTLHRVASAEAIDITLVEGPFRHFEAHWRFLALGEAAARIEYAMQYEFAGPAITALLGPLFEQIADTMVDAFIRRADAVRRDAAR